MLIKVIKWSLNKGSNGVKVFSYIIKIPVDTHMALFHERGCHDLFRFL